MSTGIQMPFDSCSKFSKIMQKAIDTNLNICGINYTFV